MRKPKSQSEEVVYAMLNSPTVCNSSITSLTMHGSPYWISNVPEAIRQARAKGYAIETKTETRGNKFKRKITIAKWNLKDRDAALILYNKTK